MKDVNFKEFKRAIEYVTESKIHVLYDVKGDRPNTQEQIVSIQGVWFSIGDLNDIGVWGIGKINHEDFMFEFVKTSGDFLKLLEKLADVKDWLLNKE